MNRRTADEIVADLQAKIEAVKNREARKVAKANPAVKHGMIALKSIDKAATETTDAAARTALDDARTALSKWLAVEGLALAPVSEKPRGRKKAV